MVYTETGSLFFCDEGMAPTATKTMKDYNILNGISKPLCHRATAVIMQENIQQITKEKDDPYLRGHSFDKIIEMYEF